MLLLSARLRSEAGRERGRSRLLKLFALIGLVGEGLCIIRAAARLLASLPSPLTVHQLFRNNPHVTTCEWHQISSSFIKTAKSMVFPIF